ncbi:cadherin-like beta sandwich domain-containing protein [Candidatus Poriferisodalis sp.]|uniref:cadherin-like beta sandwich domain-containing protein n=1 Tax=Candidatus Poriferisodalis sp. TaxID=3101277 RepID=UPI003B021906
MTRLGVFGRGWLGRAARLVAVAVAAGVLVPVGSGGAGAQEPAAFSRLPDAELDTLAAAGNEYPSALWSDGATLWVADLVEDKVFAYDLATGVRRPGDDVDSLRGAGNTYPMGMWSDGSVLWVSDGADSKVYAYDLATGAHLPFLGIETLDEAGNNWPRGLWSDGSTLWVADYWDGKVYAYDLATGERRPDDDVDSPDAAGNDRPTGLWSDGSTLWVADMADDKVYAYDFSTGARRPAGDFNTLAAAGNGRPAALWSDGSTLWVADSGKSNDDGESRLFAYRMPDSALLQSLTLSGVDFGVFSAGRFSYSVRVPSATTQTTVAAAGSGASVVIAPADADSSTDGHQVDLSPGANAITVTVTNGTLTETYNVAVERSSLGAVDDDASLSALSLSGVDIGTFDAADRRYEAVVPSTVASATVTATPTDADASVNITPADANSDPDDGHQVALGAGANNVAVTVTSSDLTVSAVYTVRVTQVDAPAVTDDASLSALTVAETDTDTAVGIGTFSADAYSYAAAVDSSVGSVTLAATPADPHASVTITPDDADTATDGHQVSLAAGASTAVTVTVVSSDLSATAQYTISVGRAYTDGVIRLDPDTTPVASMWSDGDVLWVTGPDWAHAYDLDTGARQTDRDFRLTHAHDIHGDDLNDGRFEGGGLWGDGEHLYALEGLYGGLYAYDPATGARRPAHDRNGTRPNRPSLNIAEIANPHPEGIWSDGTTMWIADSDFNRVVIIDLATGSYQSTKIRGVGRRHGNSNPRDVWSDGDVMWILDDEDDRIYAYDIDDADRHTSLEIGTLGRVGNDDPAAIWSDGDTMWVLDSEDLIVYPYTMPPRARLASLSFTDVSFGGLRSGVDSYNAAAANTVSATTVAAAATESGATVTVSPADADSNTDGHQVNLSLGSNTVTVTVTLGAQVRTYTVNVVKINVATLSSDASLSTLSFSGASTFTPGDCPCSAQVDNDVTQTTITAAATDANATVTISPADADADADGYQVSLAQGSNRITITVVSSDLSTKSVYSVNIYRRGAVRVGGTDVSLRGVWSDGKVLWAVDGVSDTLLAFDLETLERLPDRDFDHFESGRWPTGLWSDGETIWIIIHKDKTARAYSLATGERLPDSDIAIALARWGWGLWSDGDTMWVTDRYLDRLFAFDMSPGPWDRDDGRWIRSKDLVRLANFGRDTPDHYGNDTPGDLWSDTVTMWVPDFYDSKLYAYELATGDRQPQRDVDVRGTNGELTQPQGVWSDGHTMWVTDSRSDSIVTVDAPVSTLLASLALSGVDFGTFDKGTRDYSATVAATVSSATLTYEAFDPDAEVVVSPADADTDTDGHQVGLAEGANTITVTVTAPDGTATVYTVTVERAAASPPPNVRFVPGEDLAAQKQSEEKQSEEQQSEEQQSEEQQSEEQQSEEQQSEVEGQGESEQRVLVLDEIGSVVLSSGAPGELSVSWSAPGLAPFGYRVMWAREDLGYLSYWQSDETHRGNVWPAPDASSVTLSGLEEGATYKVQIRARFRSLEGKVSASPWTDEVTAVVSSSPVAQQQQADELGSDEQQSDESEQQADEPETETDGSGSGLPALTASFEELPDAHSGAGTDLVVRVRFSEPLAVSYVTMRDGGAVFVQSPHRVVKAKRVEGRSDLWDITIRVGDDRRLSVTVFKGSGCDGEHAVCTADGRPVSQAAQVFIEGPGSDPDGDL